MDSLTHILLGAAIGEALLGKQAGKKALFWGAVTATAPDVDVLIGVFLSDLDKIIFHRGWTHSLFFILCISPVYGWIISKLSRAEVNWRQWALLAFLAQATHALLDTFTSYGTQIFLPFSSHPAAISSISVLDPIFTLPLLVAVIFLLIKPIDWNRRLRVCHWGLWLATAYLGLTFANKMWVHHNFNSELERQGISTDFIDTKPTLLNNLLWRGIAEVEGRPGLYAVGYYSVADGRSNIEFDVINGNHELLESYTGRRSVQRLKWVSQGIYKVERTGSGYIFNDLRFGRVAEFATEDSPYAFSYTLTESELIDEFHVERVELQIDRDRESRSLRDLWDRIHGN